MEQEPVSLEALVERLIECGERLPKRIHRRIIAFGQEAVPELVAILEDEELARSDAVGEGYAPVHAAELLGELRAPEAVEPMLRAMVRTHFMDVLHDQILQSLPAIGAPVLEPALRALGEADGDERDSIIAVLADAGVHDDRVLELLIDELRRDPSRAADLAAYGDPRALPELYRAFDSFRIKRDPSPLANQPLVEIRDAIEELGGSLTPEQQARYRQAMEPAEAFRSALRAAAMENGSDDDSDDRSSTPARPALLPGRNEPCRCGSGKKYKRCHLDADQGHGPPP